ncbi:hypothetical protein Pfo_011231 [Paulownia fortunei]|nr:hypothetical protein Pfo_011231 [Paulownia fortunei]
MQGVPGDDELVAPEIDDENQEEEEEQLIDLEINQVQEEDNQVPPESENTPCSSHGISRTLEELMKEDDEKYRFTNLIDLFNEETKDCFSLMEPIGTASGSVMKVYKATYLAHDFEEYETLPVHDLFVAVKSIRADQELEAFDNLKQRVERNGLVPDHPNIMGIKKPFTHEGNYYVVFPFMGLGSLRCIMLSSFSNGLPEDCIVVALREALKGLSFIHGNGQVHKEISAGHIFFSDVPGIKLAFSASVYDHGLDQNHPSSSSHMPMASVFNWAAAPEVYDSENPEYTPKADIWLIGITAMELAYGEVRVLERGDLESGLEKITKEKRLPMRKQEESHQTVKESLSSAKENSFPFCMNFQVPFKRRAFSKKFEKMVFNCLALDPAKRPTADELLQSKIFKKNKKDVRYYLPCMIRIHLHFSVDALVSGFVSDTIKGFLIFICVCGKIQELD